MGQKLAKLPLPPREPGHPDKITIGGNRYAAYYRPDVDIDRPEPPAPTFDEPMEALRARIEKRTRAVRVQADLARVHQAIRALLEKDEERRKRQQRSGYVSPWDAPVFDTPLQQRRLRIASAILLALAAQGFGGSVGDKGDELTVRIGRSAIPLELAEVTSRSKKQKRGRLRLSVKPGYRTESAILGEDMPRRPLENGLRRIVVELIVLAEAQYREGRIHDHEWRLDMRRRRIEELRRQQEEAERKERERIAAIEQARIDRLLGEADSLRKAQDIRAYVQSVRATGASLPVPVPESELSAWATWALAQADRIDPVLSRRFLEDREGQRGLAPGAALRD